MYLCAFKKIGEMKRFVLYSLLSITMLCVMAQPKPIKNVILMIPDGTSTSLLSAARWYQTYLDPNNTTLNIDPYVCGLVRTHSSDAPIGDSAPTTSCYVSGQPSQTGFVSTYPVATDHDLVPVDATRAYQPLATVLEAAKILQHKSTGLGLYLVKKACGRLGIQIEMQSRTGEGTSVFLKLPETLRAE